MRFARWIGMACLLATTACASAQRQRESRICYQLTEFTPTSAAEKMPLTLRLRYDREARLGDLHTFQLQYRAARAARDAWSEGSWAPDGANSVVLASARSGLVTWEGRATMGENVINGVVSLTDGATLPQEITFSGVLLACEAV